MDGEDPSSKKLLVLQARPAQDTLVGRSSGVRSLMLFSWLQRILPMHLLSRCVGFLARSTLLFVRIPLISSFKAYFKVDLTIAERENISDYASFNDFFTRALKPGLRTPSGALSAPADGVVSAAGQVEQGSMLQAKGQSFEIADLLGDADHPFQSGSYITTYLSPKDYHRVHFPCDARLETSTYIPGTLFSVNAQTSQHIPRLFARNERLVMNLSCEQGHIAMVLVGAAIVAAIQPFWLDHPLTPRRFETRTMNSAEVAQGQEAGRFLLGSTVILLTEWSTDWAFESGEPLQMGDALIHSL